MPLSQSLVFTCCPRHLHHIIALQEWCFMCVVILLLLRRWKGGAVVDNCWSSSIA
uniref:Uncharacterized protein n=1 Tax=Setaria italica TaxID=4555 RepID=K4ANS4_SETIT